MRTKNVLRLGEADIFVAHVEGEIERWKTECCPEGKKMGGR